MTTISDLKAALGDSFGVQNKYLVEIPLDSYYSRTLNIMCKSAGFPVRNMQQTEVWRKGRKYNIRSETDYGGTYEINIIDIGGMKYRQLFDKWMKNVDNSKPANAGISGGSFEESVSGALDEINAAVNGAKMVKNIIQKPQNLADMFLGLLEGGASTAPYQSDINIWQLSPNNEKIYGYKIQNAFPINIGNVEFSDESQNTLSEFTVTFSFSEFEPLFNKSYLERSADIVFGEETVDTFNNVESLFD